MPRKAELPTFVHDDIQKIKRYLEEYPRTFLEARNRAVMALLLKTGIKTNVLTSLDLEDYARKSRTIIPKHPKAPKQIKLDRETKNILENYLDYRKDFLKPLFISSRENQYHRSDEDLRLTDRQVQRLIKKFAEIKQLQGNFTPKAFRHTLGLYYVSLGIEQTLVDSILGNVAPWIKHDYKRRMKSKNTKISKEILPKFYCKTHKTQLIRYRHKNKSG